MKDLRKAHFEVHWPKDRRFQVVAFGQNAVDSVCVLPEYPTDGGKMRIEERQWQGGGMVATAAALCARYGLKTRYVGRVGDDEAGRFSIEDLRREPMDTSLVEVVPGAYNQFAVILVNQASGERTVLWDRDDRLRYKPEELKREAIVEGQLLHLDGHDLESAVQAAKWAREAGMIVCLDVDQVQSGVEELLKLTDFAIPTLEFVRQFSDDRDWRSGMYDLGRIVAGHVIATRGAKGAALLWEDNIVSIPGFPTWAVDTTAAGDVFHGAFIHALFENRSVLQCIRFANAAAMLACTRYGARSSIPKLAEVEGILAQAASPQSVPFEILTEKPRT